MVYALNTHVTSIPPNVMQHQGLNLGDTRGGGVSSLYAHATLRLPPRKSEAATDKPSLFTPTQSPELIIQSGAEPPRVAAAAARHRNYALF